MILKILVTLFLSIGVGILYRMGGSGNYPRYLRPLGMSLGLLFELLILGYFHWTLILCMGAIYGLSTTYFKKKGSDAKWWNWILVGVAFGISVLPIVLVYHHWLGFALRTVFLSGFIPVWSLKISNGLAYHFRKVWGDDVIEEWGRGFIAIATLPLLLI